MEQIWGCPRVLKMTEYKLFINSKENGEDFIGADVFLGKVITDNIGYFKDEYPEIWGDWNPVLTTKEVRHVARINFYKENILNTIANYIKTGWFKLEEMQYAISLFFCEKIEHTFA